MKIGYFADGPWAQETFKKIISDNTLEISFMVIRYDKQDEVLKQYSNQYHIPLMIHPNINSLEFMERVSKYDADLFVSMSFNQIFKKKMIEMPRYKTINCHAGKLPYYRGCNILNWALINDEKEFGITAHYMDEGIDTGDIILQNTYPITDNDTYGTLLETAYKGCADVLYKAIKLIQKEEVKAIKQDSIDRVGTYFGRRSEGDEIINWNQKSRDIFNFVRAISRPGPRATTYVGGYEVKIDTVEMIDGAHEYKNTVGQVIGKQNNDLVVKTSDTAILIKEYECSTNIKIGNRFKERLL